VRGERDRQTERERERKKERGRVRVVFRLVGMRLSRKPVVADGIAVICRNPTGYFFHDILASSKSLTYLLMELSPSGGAAISAATQEFPSVL
jgi:hypothetical protein